MFLEAPCFSVGGACSASYPAGTSVTLTATPSTGQSFAGWSTPCDGVTTCKLTMTQGRTMYAAFAPGGSSAEALRGKWGAPIATNILAVHAHVLDHVDGDGVLEQLGVPNRAKGRHHLCAIQSHECVNPVKAIGL